MKKKFCWIAQEYRKGWKLGFCLGEDKPCWVRNIFFTTEKNVEEVLNGNLVFVHLKETKRK